MLPPTPLRGVSLDQTRAVGVALRQPIRRALILGAVNPVGCRLAEALCERGLTAVALLDDWAQASRLARLPVRMIQGRVADREALRRAMAGCDAAFHCAEYDQPLQEAHAGGLRGALGSAWRRLALPRRNLECVEAVLSVALESGTNRVICLNAAAAATAAERAALRYYQKRGLSVTVLRPATLYGPFCPWTIEAVRALRRGRRPRRPGRCLYLDHLVEAMLLAAGTAAGAGEVFPLHDPEPASCEKLLEAHAQALDGRWEPASAAGGSEAGGDGDMERARRMLGYNPTSGFAQNIECTAAWIQWSRL